MNFLKQNPDLILEILVLITDTVILFLERKLYIIIICIITTLFDFVLITKRIVDAIKRKKQRKHTQLKEN